MQDVPIITPQLKELHPGPPFNLKKEGNKGQEKEYRGAKNGRHKIHVYQPSKSNTMQVYVVPNDHGIRYQLCGWFKKPKHHFSSSNVMIAGKRSGCHGKVAYQ
jgi:hypothetical protein